MKAINLSFVISLLTLTACSSNNIGAKSQALGHASNAMLAASLSTMDIGLKAPEGKATLVKVLVVDGEKNCYYSDETSYNAGGWASCLPWKDHK